MSKVRVHSFGVSVDGFSAGPAQSMENPLGLGGVALHKWHMRTRTFQQQHGNGEGTTGIDDEFEVRGLENIGAYIMGRNMFGPLRGPWPDQDWKGWWGENPPYHVPVFVLTSHYRPSLEMAGGTVFHFITEGIEAALVRAKAAAGGRDIRIAGGASTVRQYLSARLIDQMHLAISPALLGGGTPLFAGIDLPKLGYEVIEHTSSDLATHVVIARRD
jgi:dihydrofolate reductase